MAKNTFPQVIKIDYNVSEEIIHLPKALQSLDFKSRYIFYLAFRSEIDLGLKKKTIEIFFQKAVQDKLEGIFH